MANYNILLVEDSDDVYQLVQHSLGQDYNLDWAPSLKVAKQMITEKRYNLILLDVMLPDGDGYQLCSLLQAQPATQDIPVIFLTAKNSTSDKVLGFSVGADDYIAKPFDGLELRARVETKFRKQKRERMRFEVQRLGPIEINRESQKVSLTNGPNKQDLDLTPIEFKLLVFLAREPNKVYTRDDILNGVWGENVHVFSRSVDTHISKLRKKLGPYSESIQSVHGSGYKLAIEHREPQAASMLI
ncbi:MAG: response regulator transcription factor [Pseudobdellovibrionaceae bacterium]